jgi:hypothetical protein
MRACRYSTRKYYRSPDGDGAARRTARWPAGAHPWPAAARTAALRGQDACINGVGPRVQESALGLIPGYAYSGPNEDITLAG